MKRSFLNFLYNTYVRIIGIVKPISVGVRVLLIQDKKVLMVRHTYQDEWYLVGGGTKRKETLEEAARREAMEEADASLGDVELFGIYTNIFFLRTDHIAVFLCEDFTYTGEHDREIEAIELFPLDALPENTAPGIRRRIEEYRNGSVNQQFGSW